MMESEQAFFFGWLRQIDPVNLFEKMGVLLKSPYHYLVDRDQHVMYWSSSMEALTGQTEAAVLGKTAPMALTIPEDCPENGSVKIDSAQSGLLPFYKTVQKFYDPQGYFLGAMGLLSKDSDQEPVDVRAKVDSGKSTNFHGILSRSPIMRDIFQIIENAAMTEATVLVRGESGSGKELVARAIHTLSARSQSPFLAINCAALSANLLESELFGHVRGAFTGAVRDHSGLFQRANGGTLFLDEVAELPLELQAKLLRVLQERNYIPVGGNRTIDVDVRIVAATHRSLREEVRKGNFREDLMYRLRVVPIFLPALRERREDLSLLIWHFINLHNNPQVRVIEKIDPDAMRALLDYRWPGNVRELHNVVEYAFAVGRGTVLRLSELPPEFRETQHRKPEIVGKEQRTVRLSQNHHEETDESAVLKAALEQCRGRAGEAAKLLGMSRATFWRKRKQYGI
jgi:transcriptional regulator with PAS, ATPase and Fis domain